MDALNGFFLMFVFIYIFFYLYFILDYMFLWLWTVNNPAISHRELIVLDVVVDQQLRVAGFTST